MKYVTGSNIESVIKKMMKEQLSDIADDGLEILKDVAPSDSGEMVNSMYKEEYEDGYFVGTDTGTCLHAKYANDGNPGNSGNRIVPTHAKALKTPYGYFRSVSTYKGSHFTTKAARMIASKYGKATST